MEFVGTLLLAFALVFGFVRPVLAAPFKIPTESMEPTIQIGDRVLANKLVYYFREPERGDIVVFEGVENPKKDFIKRVVATGGDRVEIRDGALLVNGEPENEPYTYGQPTYVLNPSYASLTVPEDHLFAMGDNRTGSHDSRAYGPVPYEKVEGEALLRFWPPGRAGAP